MGKFDLQCLWQKEVQILDEIDRICKKHKIEYFLMWGTLIGAVRHQGFIPWDDDVDISMPRKDFRRFLKIAKKELGNEYFLQTAKSDKYHPTYYAKVRLNNTAFYASVDRNKHKHHGIFVDVIPLDSCKEKQGGISKIKKRIFNVTNVYLYERKQGYKVTKYKFLKFLPTCLVVKIRELAMRGWGKCYTSWGYTFKKADFHPATELKFMDKNYPVPKDYDKVLTTIYGNYMELPPEDKRIAHSPAFISYDLKRDEKELKIFLEKIDD